MTIKLLLLLTGQPDRSTWDAQDIAFAIQMTGVDHDLMLAIALHETGFRPWAVGADGETGPWQVHPVHRNEEWNVACRVFPDGCPAWHALTAARVLQRGRVKCGSLDLSLLHI